MPNCTATELRHIIVWVRVLYRQSRSQGSLLPALRSERERDHVGSVGRVGENPGNEVAISFVLDTFKATHVSRKWSLFHFKAPWRYQICISKCLYYYRDDLFKHLGKNTLKNEKKTTSGWRASLKLSSLMTQHTGGIVLKHVSHTRMHCFFFLECELSFSSPGNYTETLNDAEIAIGLQPSFLKVFIRGELLRFGLNWARPSLAEVAREVLFDKEIRKPILQNVLVFSLLKVILKLAEYFRNHPLFQLNMTKRPQLFR